MLPVGHQETAIREVDQQIIKKIQPRRVLDLLYMLEKTLESPFRFGPDSSQLLPSQPDFLRLPF
jgi:hypothetical protein